MTAFLRLMTPLPSPLQLLQTLLRVLATLSLGPASPLQWANSFLSSLPLKLWSSFHSQSHSLAQQSMINPGSEVRATSVLAHSSMSQFGQKGMLYTMEHIHLLERILEGQTLRFHSTESSGLSSCLALRALRPGRASHSERRRHQTEACWGPV